MATIIVNGVMIRGGCDYYVKGRLQIAGKLSGISLSDSDRSTAGRVCEVVFDTVERAMKVLCKRTKRIDDASFGVAAPHMRSNF